MSNICRICGKSYAGRYSYKDNICQGCYNYFRKGGTVNDIPEEGKIEYDKYGKVICHICGRAYKRLGSHVRESHDMTIAQYKERFGICECSKTTERTYSNIMKMHAYENGTPKLLTETGFNTRFKTGEHGKRYGRKARLQECLNKRFARS